MKKLGFKSKKNKSDANSESSVKLSFDEFARFFEKLSDDVINDMLIGAKLLSQEQIDAILADEESRPRMRLSTKVLLIILALEVFLMPLAINKIYMSATINDDNPITYSAVEDEIFCDDGHLRVNNVDVAVPVSGNEKYSISYSWASGDTDYPSVPHSANVMYPGEETSKYEIALYKNEFIEKKKIPKGKTAENWFDDWSTESEDKDVSQKKLKSGAVNGFYISPIVNEQGESSYENYSYYFAVQDDAGISIYVLEGNCTEKDKAAEFSKLMDGTIKGISIIEKPAPKEQKDKDQANQENESDQNKDA